MYNKIIDLKSYETVEFPWGVGVRHRKGRWESVILKPNGFVIPVHEHNVILHDNGIEFEVSENA